jgi:F0F1-type ATP synthase membrane subunit a
LALGLALLVVFVVTKNRGENLVPNTCQSLVELIYDSRRIDGLSKKVKQEFFHCTLVTFAFSLLYVIPMA